MSVRHSLSMRSISEQTSDIVTAGHDWGWHNASLACVYSGDLQSVRCFLNADKMFWRSGLPGLKEFLMQFACKRRLLGIS